MEVTTPDGAMHMWFAGEYLEVIQNQRLVYTDAVSDEHGNVLSPEQAGMPAEHPTTTEVRVELEPVGGGTRMTLTHVGIPAGSPGGAGWAMALDKLTSHLSARVIRQPDRPNVRLRSFPSHTGRDPLRTPPGSRASGAGRLYRGHEIGQRPARRPHRHQPREWTHQDADSALSGSNLPDTAMTVTSSSEVTTHLPSEIAGTVPLYPRADRRETPTPRTR